MDDNITIIGSKGQYIGTLSPSDITWNDLPVPHSSGRTSFGSFTFQSRDGIVIVKSNRSQARPHGVTNLVGVLV
jgi:hypothetical protein